MSDEVQNQPSTEEVAKSEDVENGNGTGNGIGHAEDDNNTATPAAAAAATAGATDNTEFVLIADASGEPMEIPTNEDNSLFMTTLQATFPGATGLKYKNPKTGASRAVVVDPNGTRLLPPADGWEGKVFTVIIPTGRESSAKRRKVGSEGESDSDGEGTQRKRGAIDTDGVRQPVDLIVLGVNYKTTDETFKTYFESFGTVVFAEIKRTSEGTSKGFGFVRMSTIEEQDKVVAETSHMLDGRRCDVKVPDPRGGFGGNRNPITKIFVGRLTDKVTDANLQEFFAEKAKAIVPSASVTDVFVPKPFRGFAFVSFSHSECAEKISKQGSYLIEGVSVAVSLAVPREEGPPHGRGGQYMNDFGYSYGYGKGGAGFSSGYGNDKYSRYPSPNVFGSGAARGGGGGGGGAYEGGWVPAPSGGGRGGHGGGGGNGPWRPPANDEGNAMMMGGGGGMPPPARYNGPIASRTASFDRRNGPSTAMPPPRGFSPSARGPPSSNPFSSALASNQSSAPSMPPGLGSHQSAAPNTMPMSSSNYRSPSGYSPFPSAGTNTYSQSFPSEQPPQHLYSQSMNAFGSPTAGTSTPMRTNNQGSGGGGSRYSQWTSDGDPRQGQGQGQQLTGASTIANGLDALNLGSQNPEFLSALNAFYNTLRGNYAAQQQKWKS